MSIKKLYRIAERFLREPGNKRKRDLLRITSVIIMSILLAGVGHFLFSGEMGPDTGISPENSPSGSGVIPSGPADGGGTRYNIKDHVRYTHRSEVINRAKQEINILEVGPSLSGVRIQPVLSHDLIYGFEKLSVMAARKNAYAAVTGGFFSQYGLPAGMVMIGGELITASTGEYPVFIVDNGKAVLREIKSRLTIEYVRGKDRAGESDNGIAGNEGNQGRSGTRDGTGGNAGIFGIGGASGSGSVPVDVLNLPAAGKETAVYTPVYGIYNRAGKSNITATVENGAVTDISFYYGEAEIPENGMLITFFETEKYDGDEIPLRVGDRVKLSHEPAMESGADAYECGCRLVKDGKIVAPLKDPWVGVLTNRDPRTAVGIKKDGTVILLTVDGRQSGYSAGFTGKELAEYMIACGAENAAMLDGGASAEMLVEGKLVSRPSYKGEERELGGGLLVLSANQK